MSFRGANLVFTFFVLLPFSFQETCDSFRGLKEKDRALLGHTFDSSRTEDSFSCAERCLDCHRCRSYNYALSGPQRGLCELNSVGTDPSNPLQYRSGFVFVQLANRHGQETGACNAKPIKPSSSGNPSTTTEPVTKISESQQASSALQPTGTTFPSPSSSRPHVSASEPRASSAPTALRSCFEAWKNGSRVSGTFLIKWNNNRSSDVYCDFHSEPGWVWTLVMSHSHEQRQNTMFSRKSYGQPVSVKEQTPNIAAHRLGRYLMRLVQSHTTHWRVTCSFPAHGRVDYRDYVRANFTELDPMTLQSESGECKRVEYMDVRSHNCTGCTSEWRQVPSRFLYHDSSSDNCEFGATVGFVSQECNFGSYKDGINPAFRCTSSDSATTNHWFGRRVEPW